MPVPGLTTGPSSAIPPEGAFGPAAHRAAGVGRRRRIRTGIPRAPHRGSETGGTEQLERLASRLLSQRVDLDRPLWEMWLVEGLAKGRWALINKAHHAMIDRLSGHDIMEVILDLAPEGSGNPPSTWTPQPEPGTVDLVTDAVIDSVKRPGQHLSRIVGRVSNPRELVEHLAVRAAGSTSVGSRLISTESALGGQADHTAGGAGSRPISRPSKRRRMRSAARSTT